MTLEEVESNALALPLDQRSLLVAALLESLENSETDLEIPPEWREEINRRVHEIDAGQVTMVTLEEFKERFDRR